MPSAIDPAAPAAPVTTDRFFSIEGLNVTYPPTTRTAQPVAALRDIDLSVDQGEFVSVVGPSGCGKSTLLSTIIGLLSGYEGRIVVRGETVTGPHRDVGAVFQEESTFPWRTVQKNVEFGLEMRGVGKVERRRRALDMLKLVGLEDFVGSYPGQLSGGMKQRVAIARTLVMHPAILLMDEPFGALDEQTRIILGEELLRIQRTLEQTILLITHNIQEAVLLSNRIVVLGARPGRIKAVVEVDLPRDRDSSLLATDEFAAIVGRVWSVLRDESLQAFAREQQAPAAPVRAEHANV
ncbi:ABC transporter ATP-binding protein [Pseudonocardia nematodicida]|uniref:ABC transporter ATP-binding protein n=1 Tax=Pseudonocardia nematodicida TaxID=1206997 RepID=A0ABM5PTL4_9PSEU